MKSVAYRLTRVTVFKQIKWVLRGQIDGVGGEPISPATVQYLGVLVVDAFWELARQIIIIVVHLIVPENETFLESYRSRSIKRNSIGHIEVLTVVAFQNGGISLGSAVPLFWTLINTQPPPE